MIVQCKTVEELDDVFKFNNETTTLTEKEKRYFFNECDGVCIEEHLVWMVDANWAYEEDYLITPYADWKLLKQIENEPFVKLNTIELRQIDHYYAIYVDYKMREYGLFMSPIELLNKIKYYEGLEKMREDKFIQLEGGKLNITEAKRLGLWVEDKKVFTIDKNCMVECKNYKVFSCRNANNKRIIRFEHNGEMILVIHNPTPDKVRSEFAYYGIDVEVK